MSFDDAYRTTASPRLELPQGNSFPKKLDRGDDDDDVEVEVRACEPADRCSATPSGGRITAPVEARCPRGK